MRITQIIVPAACWLALSLFMAFETTAQTDASNEVAFISDTQAPMWIENVFLKANQNKRATKMLFDDIMKLKPHGVYILGDVVSLGYKNSKWASIDECIDGCRANGIEVHALLGNHDVMRRSKKGEKNFQKRFSDHVRTGYYHVVDSMAIVLVNSNFGKLTSAEITSQQEWYVKALASLDKDPAVKVIIVTCHHAPFSNSKLVGSSKPVQDRFVAPFLKSQKSLLFITGHSHTFEYFKRSGKDFLVIGGGGGIHQPLGIKLEDKSGDYKPMFHYLTVKRNKNTVTAQSRYIKTDFSSVEKGFSFTAQIP